MAAARGNIAGVGIDIVAIDRVWTLWVENHSRFKECILTELEIELMPFGRLKREEHLATRFAAKEATIKVLSLSNSVPYELNDIEVVGDRQVTVQVAGHLRARAEALGFGKITGSCSVAGRIAVAVVMGESA